MSKAKAKAEQKSIEENELSEPRSSGRVKKVIICFFILQLFFTFMSCLHDWMSWDRYMAATRYYEDMDAVQINHLVGGQHE